MVRPRIAPVLSHPLAATPTKERLASPRNPIMKSPLCLLIAALAATAYGCGSETAAIETTRMVFFDTKTNRPVVADATTETPAVNPKTGNRTLLPAAYCPDCKAWHAAPPLEEIQRNPQALVCPKTKAKMTFKGPEID